MPISVKVLLQPAGEPLTLTEAKLACRVDADLTADDGFISDLIMKARVYCEDLLGQALISQTMLFTFDRLPRSSQVGGLQSVVADQWGQFGPAADQRTATAEITAQDWLDRSAWRPPRSPLQSVITIQYTDLQNALQTLDPALYRVDYMSDPARIVPVFAQIWPFNLQQAQALKIQAVVGFGPSTSIALAVSAGVQTVTPASMYGIYPQNLTVDPFYAGTVLAIDTGENRELVCVTAVTGSTFTATFAKAHSAGAIVKGAVPETTRGRMRMLISHWYTNRDAVGSGQSVMPLAAEAMHYVAWNGELM